MEGQFVRVGTTRKLLLRVTDVARTELGIQGQAPGRESLVHEYWKRYYAQRFRELGYRVTLEAPRKDGRVDVLAVKVGEDGARVVESVAIESGDGEVGCGVECEAGFADGLEGDGGGD